MTSWDDDRIADYWAEQAEEHGADPAASWSDHHAIALEIEELVRRVPKGHRVLDAGCGNGYTAIRLALRRDVAIHGVDYIDKLIESARAEATRLQDEMIGLATFDVGDVTSLAFDDESFDTVVCVRVLINLGSWDKQRVGLEECLRVLRPGGELLLSEATLQGWRRLNALRGEWGLDEIPMPPFNLYLDQEAVAAALPDDCRLVEIVDFASSYYVGTRVLKPLLASVTGKHDIVADPDAEWNRLSAALPAWGDYGTQKLFVIAKG